MKRTLFAVVVSLGLSANALVANDMLTQEEKALIFNSQEVNVIALDEQEMRETKGEGVFAAIGYGILGGIGYEVGKDIWNGIKSWF